MMMYAVFTQHLMQLEREQSRTHLVGGWSWSAGDGGGLYFVVAFRSVSEVGHRFFSMSLAILNQLNSASFLY